MGSYEPQHLLPESFSSGTPSSQELIYHECSAPLCLIGITTCFSKGESPNGDFQVFQRLSATNKKNSRTKKPDALRKKPSWIKASGETKATDLARQDFRYYTQQIQNLK